MSNVKKKLIYEHLKRFYQQCKVITDKGISNENKSNTLIERKDVKIDVIAFNINDEDDLAQLQCTSLVTGGKFYTANTAAELAKSLQNSTNVSKEVEAKIIPNRY